MNAGAEAAWATGSLVPDVTVATASTPICSRFGASRMPDW